MAEMDYIELSKTEKLWAPSEYAWECLKCPHKVRILDGNIDPKKGSILVDRCRERNRLELFTSIGIIAFGQKRPPKVNPKPEVEEEGAKIIPIKLAPEDPKFTPQKVWAKVIPKKQSPEATGVTGASGPA